MGKIVISQNVTLDGVVQDPTGEEGSSYGGWFEQMTVDDRRGWAEVQYDEALRASALLLGRRSDAYFGDRWNTQTSDWAVRLNGLPKYVVSATITAPVWQNATVLKGDVLQEISNIAAEIDGEIVVYASRQLVHTLLANDLVDEIRLTVFPVVTGAGERLFAPTNGSRTLRRSGSRAVGDNLTHLTYQVVRTG
ncbi:dihydrofolate reductase family protein [Nakamurella lactea]|uniref:dihydrofolate reductase family protein n=1 Tax=Nakamurella lactea TaxID=459515 RepID=UPI0003F940FE|nr:dihydrofolate reductase family protein [Nakamurella lactea]